MYACDCWQLSFSKHYSVLSKPSGDYKTTTILTQGQTTHDCYYLNVASMSRELFTFSIASFIFDIGQDDTSCV